MGESPRDDAIAAIRAEMQEVMEESAGIYRTGPGLLKGVDELRGLQERVTRVGVRDTSKVFNTELLASLEAANMLDVAECILASGVRREESRGAHQRTDFPDRDDERFLVHHLVHRGDDGVPAVSQQPVTITRWPPGERVYGR
jgi:fumarate reductase flavoprotein subunit